MDYVKLVFVGMFSLVQGLGWLMALGGTGKLHDDCDYACDEIFRHVWWSIFFQLFVMVATVVFVATGLVDKVRIPLVAFLAITTVRTMEAAEEGLVLKDRGIRRDGATNAVVGGFILMSMMNFVLIALIGHTFEVSLGDVSQRVNAAFPKTQQPPVPSVPPTENKPPQPATYPTHDGFPPSATFDYTQQQQQQNPQRI